MRTHPFVAIVATVVAASGFVGVRAVVPLASVPTMHGPHAERPEGKPVSFTSGHDFFASQTAADWASNSDHVVEVKMTAEKGGRKSKTSQDRVGTFHVKAVLNSRQGARSLPSDFQMLVNGWGMLHGVRRPIVFDEGNPRFEVGHTYVIAVRYMQPRCNDDDGVEPGHWMEIGQKGAVPNDDGELGEGEVGGNTHTDLGGTPGTVTGDVASGEIKTINELRDAIADASHQTREHQPGDRDGC